MLNGFSERVSLGNGGDVRVSVRDVPFQRKRTTSSSGASVAEDGDDAETATVKKKKRKAVEEPETPTAEDQAR